MRSTKSRDTEAYAEQVENTEISSHRDTKTQRKTTLSCLSTSVAYSLCARITLLTRYHRHPRDDHYRLRSGARRRQSAAVRISDRAHVSARPGCVHAGTAVRGRRLL